MEVAAPSAAALIPPWSRTTLTSETVVVAGAVPPAPAMRTVRGEVAGVRVTDLTSGLITGAPPELGQGHDQRGAWRCRLVVWWGRCVGPAASERNGTAARTRNDAWGER
jgi:hypothetical protein